MMPWWARAEHRRNERTVGPFVRAISVAAVVFVSLPTLVVLLSSFTAGDQLRFPPEKYSLRPYVNLLENGVLRAGLLRSLTIGVLSVVIALVVGIPAALALLRYRVRFAPLFSAYLMLGVSTPLVVSGLAFLVLFNRAHLMGRLWPLAVALTIVNLPILLWALASAIQALNPELEEAAATLGAEEIQTFLFVTLPGIMPGVLTGALLMFVFGMTEFLVSLILTTTSNATLPVLIFGSLRGALNPTLAAAGGIYILIALIMILGMTRIRSLSQFLYRGD